MDLIITSALRDDLLRYFYTRPYGEVHEAVPLLRALPPIPAPQVAAEIPAIKPEVPAA